MTLKEAIKHTAHTLTQWTRDVYRAFTRLHPVMRGYWYGAGAYLLAFTFSKAYGAFYGIIILIAISTFFGLMYSNKRYLEIAVK